MFSKIFIITLIVGIASAATAIGRPAPKPAALAHKKGCYIKEINDVIPYGRSNIAGHCMEVVCKEERTFYSACSTQPNTDPNCKLLAGDSSKPFPECCPKTWCKTQG
ncbi:uncharacterized protein LOC126910767 isoform X2 [Spodoptera frugiperda]|uniref:Uncharacterized protein LOC126910767 isoform X2 n=1 Tax=Spodoptera frugiperda TaxID=7108 RepID=A0A9R0DMV8_SPOFR|nr:uncharacterized protein LOC126910767 isoform X2 [Spodoptera frugiperda]